LPLRILIVDDTIVYRQILSEVISSFDDIESVETAQNGALALRYLERHKVDLVLLDVQMPVMDGIETLKNIHALYPSINVVMVSGCSKELASITMQALRMGALEFIRKPEGRDREENKQKIRRELKSIISIIRTRALLYSREQVPVIPQAPPPVTVPGQGIADRVHMRLRPRSFAIVVIGVSTGGPNALARLVSNIDASFPLPILTVQHMPPNFTAALAEDLAKKSDIKVLEATENMPLSPGTMIIAKGGSHMVVRMKDGVPVIGINDEPPENSCRPAVDVLFRSVAHTFGEKGVIALVMTGMGSDGLAGVRALKRKSCHCITQSAPSCVVYGMPRAIDTAGLSDESVDLENIAERLISLARKLG